MPNTNFISRFHTALKTLLYPTISLFVVLCLAAVAHAQAEEAPAQSSSFLGDLLSNYGLTLILIAVLIVLVVVVYRRKKASSEDFFTSKPAPRPVVAQPQEKSVAAAPAKPALALENERPQRQSQWETTSVDYEHSAFGAYRIDQEVGKLILGKPHRMDVMSSRVADDRRAIEASLIKALGAPDVDAAGTARAREALEQYGFVARQCAILLQGRDAWERSSAARVLGQIRSSASLTALIEALHDKDSVVRNQAVTSLGRMKQPAAIGALLDIARRHSDIPPALLSDSLSACSVDSLGYLDSTSFDLGASTGQGELLDLEPAAKVEDLPPGDADDELLTLLTRLDSSDATERASISRELGTHHAQRSVSALCATALHDPDASVRSAAVTALGSINHESVFAPVLISLSDETREVRAAAARTLSSLHFDRAEAYARVMETADLQTLRDVAQACITTGIVAQAVDRLASEDRRQAHEAHSLFSLLAKAGETKCIFDVIDNHKDNAVRLAAVRVLSNASDADTALRLREAVASEGMPEDLRTAILEVLYKLDKPQPVL